MSKKKEIATALLGITTAFIIWITILNREALIGAPIRYTPFHALLSFVKEIQRGRLGANFFGNIVLFVPMGFFIPPVIGKQKWYWTIGIGFCFSLLIEIIQLVTARGCFDPDDMILNTLGTAIGYGLYRGVVHKKTVDANSI